MKPETLKDLKEEIAHYFNNYPFADKRIFVSDNDGHDVYEIPKDELIVEVQELADEAFEFDKNKN